ncbi:hypothetical protein SNE40_008890 [Patella caerulea]|uniref:Reverse transcriptase n=1 Tax=Patella caerulea TaxID=87958 RepID=A0AAN8JR49_PATCE
MYFICPKSPHTTKSPGPDNLHPKVLKELADVLKLPLSKLYRKSVDEGVLPEHWKAANITPLYKKGSKKKAFNYRPISLTSIVIKVLESILIDAIIKHLDSYNILCREQYGFSWY